ncbi:MAG: site-specific integrase [Candidatus Latescibacterota bacterium]
MLRHYVRTAAGQRRHRETPLGPYLDGFAAYLEDQGFTLATVYADLKTATAFGEYLQAQGRPVHDIRDADLPAFVRWYASVPRRFGPPRAVPGGVGLHEHLRGTVRKLLRYLRSIAVIAPEPTLVPAVPHADVLGEYLRFLEVHRGFARSTVAMHARSVAALLGQLDQQALGCDLGAVTSEAVEQAVAAVLAVGSAGSGPRQAQIITSNVEAFVRHLRMTGQVPPTCRPFLPHRRRYALAPLPPALPWSEVQRALATIDRRSPQGRRDYALCQLLATYGLRRSEVVGLQLDDIDWRGGVLRIRQRKTRRELQLPLVQPVVDALVSYLRDGRSPDADRHVFQKIHAPRGPISTAIVYGVVRTMLRRAGIQAPQYGPHLLRHARATALVRQGHSLKVVGDLLGHRVPEATLIYCKLAVEDLRQVALELPEVAP